MKKSYTATFKAQVVLELLKETKTLSQFTSEYGVHATVLRDWKQAALKGLPDVFERRHSLTDVKATYERQLEDLYAEIGRLTTQVNFLKKSCRPEPWGAAGAGGVRCGRAPAQHPSQAAQHQPPEFVLPAQTATAGGSGDQAPYRRVVHRPSILWLAQADRAAGADVWADQSQARATLYARDGDRRHRTRAEPQQTPD